MPSFDKEFVKSKGKPIKYKGKILTRIDSISVSNNEKFKLTFEKFGSKWRQGVIIKVNGSIFVNNEEFKGGEIVLLEDSSPKEVVFSIKSKDGKMKVYNVWDTGDGVMQAFLNGAVMIVEKIQNGNRYWCNDAHPDEDFDDLVFRIEKI